MAQPMDRRRRHPYDMFWVRGRADTIARDTIFKGTALSAPVSNLLIQAALTAVVTRRPSRRAARALVHGGLPYLAVGEGPPLVVFSGLSAEHANPTGLARWFEVQTLKPLARQFTVYAVNRKPGLPSGSTIKDLAGHYAEALAREFSGPVCIQGISTGGSIAQQFAIDHPQLVRRLVLAATACRLSAHGREVQRRFAQGHAGTLTHKPAIRELLEFLTADQPSSPLDEAPPVA